MRSALVFVAGAAALLSGCSSIPSPTQKEASRSAQQDWVLIAPPDNTLTTAFFNTFEFLPDGNDRFPRKVDGLNDEDRRALQSLFERVRAAPSPAESLKILTESSAQTEAPIGEWRQVRTFKSASACQSIRAQLLEVTHNQTQKFGAHANMPREEFQWPMLARSFEWSRCVPRDGAGRAQG
jgi:hypothetical protein